jgi:pyruvate,orthophosphate dikinase
VEADLTLLKTLRLKGMADMALLERALRTGAADATARLEAAVKAGYVRVLPRGATLTSMGRAALSGLESAERTRSDLSAMKRVYERFTGVNVSFKALMKDWQVRSVNGSEVPNDHLDAAYDASVVARLTEVHANLTPILKDAATLASRLTVYVARLSDALVAVQGGERTMLASPSRDSYHTVWFELHQELIELCGRSRAVEAVAGRAE